VAIVFDAAEDDGGCSPSVEDFDDFDAAILFFRQLFLGQEVMFEPVDQTRRSVGDVFEATVTDVGLQDGNDLVLRFVAVHHAVAADRHRTDNEVGVCGGSRRTGRPSPDSYRAAHEDEGAPDGEDDTCSSAYHFRAGEQFLEGDD
jgi:hypothetical protein